MTILKTILEEAIGMFVDDGMLALLCVALIAVATLIVLAFAVPGIWAGLLLLAGSIVILAWSVLRASR